MSEEHKDFNIVSCCDCGIKFAFDKKIEEMWRESEKTFFCPNGHHLHWSKPKETPEQKELKSLRSKVTDLEKKLEAAKQEADNQKKRADDLQAELEIWRPSTAETNDGSQQTGSGDRAGE